MQEEVRCGLGVLDGLRAEDAPGEARHQAGRVQRQQDPVPRPGRDPGPVVQREGHRTLRHTRAAGDVGDGGAARGHLCTKAV